MSPIPRNVLWGILCLGILVTLLFVAKTSEPRGTHGTTPPGREADISQERAKAMIALEQERDALDRTVWAKEILAESYEQQVVELWDQLRHEPNPFKVLGRIEFGTLTIGHLGAPRETENGIKVSGFGEPLATLRPEDWRGLLDRLQAEGFRLAQSDWRLVGFEHEPGNNPRSEIAISLNCFQSNRPERWVIRGTLKVTWREKSTPLDRPILESINALKLEFLRRTGEPIFQKSLSQRIDPVGSQVFIDPLILFDLNGDGLSEIVLGCRNRVYWNLGEGRFRSSPLCPHLKEPINTALIADVSGDGTADVLAADAGGLLLLEGDASGTFERPPKRVWSSAAALPNPFVMTAGDVDGDGDLDVWLAQYKLPYLAGQMPTPYFNANDGFPSFLLLNDGMGGFHDHTENAGLAGKRFRRTYSSSLVDLDGDDDLDLVVVSDFAGVDLYYNNGSGVFAEMTALVLDESHGFGMAHTFGDYDRDGRMDFLMIGMNSHVADRLDAMGLGLGEATIARAMRSKMAFGNRMYFSRGSRFEETDIGRGAAKSGWSWGATSFDFDNDGDLDIYVANGHKSRASARDYETQFWRHDLDLASSSHNEVLDLYFRSVGTRLYGAGYSYGGYYKNRLFINQNGASFLEAGFLAGCSLEEDSRNVVSDDLDGDGRLDLILTTFEEWPQPRQGLHLLKNVSARSGNWIGIRLRESGPGLSPIGSQVTVALPGGSQTKRFVTGDSYRSQHSNTAHFGLDGRTNVLHVDVRWPNGMVQRLSQPAVNRYHTVNPPAHRKSVESQRATQNQGIGKP